MTILVLVGSLRADSLSAQVAAAALTHLPAGVDAHVFTGLADLPHYSQDLDGDVVPEAVTDFRAAVAKADGILVVTPEYNGSIPSALKNAIDWASRPRGSAAIDGVPAAVIGASPSPRGAQWAHEHAVRVLTIAGSAVIEDSVGVPAAHESVREGRFTEPTLEARVAALVARLAAAAKECVAA